MENINEFYDAKLKKKFDSLEEEVEKKKSNHFIQIRDINAFPSINENLNIEIESMENFIVYAISEFKRLSDSPVADEDELEKIYVHWTTEVYFNTSLKRMIEFIESPMMPRFGSVELKENVMQKLNKVKSQALEEIKMAKAERKFGLSNVEAQMTDAELELAILRKYVKHHDSVGTTAHKCARELDMREVISGTIGRPADEVVVKRWHARLAPPSPYPAGVLRPCTDSTVNNGPHRFHARAYFTQGNTPAWDRISELESKIPAQTSIKKEKEQKFGILNSLSQAKTDFTSYSSRLSTDVSIGVLFLDIDNFKVLNSSFTESVVDQEILIPFQNLLSTICLYRGEAYRHGGEEFLVLLPNYTDDEIIQFAELVRGRIEAEKFSVGESAVRITGSIGIALWPKHGKTLDVLITKANKAEHKAKDKGKNRIEVYREDTA